MSSDSEQSNDQITGGTRDEMQEDAFDQDELADESSGELNEETNSEASSESDGEPNDEPEDTKHAGETSSDTGESNAGSGDDEAPDEVQFSSTKKTALQLAESQQNVLNRLKKQAQEKRKLNQERNVERKKLKTAKSSAVKEGDESTDERSDDEKRSGDLSKSIEKETESSRLKIILNVDDQVDRMNNKFIKKYRETNNRMVSFKERCIQSNPNIKRTENSEASRLLHKRRVR